MSHDSLTFSLSKVIISATLAQNRQKDSKIDKIGKIALWAWLDKRKGVACFRFPNGKREPSVRMPSAARPRSLWAKFSSTGRHQDFRGLKKQFGHLRTDSRFGRGGFKGKSTDVVPDVYKYK